MGKQPKRTRYGVAGLVSLSVALFTLAACSAPETPGAGDEVTSAQQSSATQSGAAVPAGFEQYYDQQIDFVPCEAKQVTLPVLPVPKDLAKYQCATVKAPLNWDDPKSEPISLSIARYEGAKNSGKEQTPYLFYNLGGPGGDAVRSLSAFVGQMAPEILSKSFQILALDPRGVGQSTPVQCWSDEEKDQNNSDHDGIGEGQEPGQTAAEIIEQYREESVETSKKCHELSGDIVGFVDTDSAARDFDMVRSALGQGKFNYLGYSYGTFLGATYAELFPENVGKMVLDGALDPEVDSDGISALQARGMEQSLYHWIETCQQQRSCPLSGDLESGKKQVMQFLEELEEDPLPTSDVNRLLTQSLAKTGIIGSLYSTSSYEYLTMAYQLAQAGDGSALLMLADYYNGRENDGSYDNSSDAFTVINMLDYEPSGSEKDWEENANKIAAENPVLGQDFGFSNAGLEEWQFQSRQKKHKLDVKGAPQILIVGTTHDPATPYVMAQGLQKQIDGSVLVTKEGWDHGAYSRDGSKCIQMVVNSYLLKGVVPPEGTVCEDE